MGKKIPILGTEYEIDGSRTSEELENCWGVANFIEKKVYIASDQSKESWISTLIHEIFELIKYHYRVNARESDILKLEEGTFRLLQDIGFDMDQLLEEQ